MSTATTTDLAKELQRLEDDLSNFWLAPFFPMPGTTTAGIKRRAMSAGRKAVGIMEAAKASGDAATEKAAPQLAQSLVPYAERGRAS